MADFGNTGTVTIRTNNETAEVRVSAGEFLAYKLTVEGAAAIFTFICARATQLSQQDFAGDPKQVYQWTWCHSAANPPDVLNRCVDARNQSHQVAMQFAAAIKYTLLIEHCDLANTLIKTVKDIDFESQGPEDLFVEGLNVRKS
jgi:hypothetical protein